MRAISLVCLFLAGVNAVRQSAGSSSFSGGYSGTGTGYGGSGGSGSGYGGTGYGETGYGNKYAYPGYAPFAPFPPTGPIVDSSEFHNYISDYFQALQRNHAASVSLSYASPEATAYAEANLYPSDELYRQQIAQQNAILNSIPQTGAAYGGYAPNFAGASASYGPSGIRQTAYISPSNPASPNIDTRFDATGISSGKPGYYGVSTSSFSESSDINGVKSNRRGGMTTVNDNGKITVHKTHS